MKTKFLFLFLLLLVACTKADRLKPNYDASTTGDGNRQTLVEARDTYLLVQGTFDIGAETLHVNGHSGRLPQVCKLSVLYRPHQYSSKLGGWYPTVFFLFKDVYPNENPDHFLFARDFELEFLTDEACGDDFDLLDHYTGTWDNEHAFLAAILHPSMINCWTEGAFSFVIAANFPLSCDNTIPPAIPYPIQEVKRSFVPFVDLPQ